MSLLAHNDLPAFADLQQEGADVVVDQSQAQPHLRIALLNLVPDAVLQATERQWLRLLANYTEAQISFFPITVASEQRSEAAQDHIAQHYESFDSIRTRGIDALIVTGANPRTEDITQESFWQPMLDILDWARQDGCSILYSCLAVHAAMHAYLDTERNLLPQKCWGVYPHRRNDPKDPLVQGIEEGWALPHSRRYEITREQFEDSGMRILIESQEAGVLLAVDGENAEQLYFQGHPEYDVNSLLKEYKREVLRFFDGVRDDYPPNPENYFPVECAPILEDYKVQLSRAKQLEHAQPEFPEEELMQHLRNSWATSGERLLHNWLGQVQLATVS